MIRNRGAPVKRKCTFPAIFRKGICQNGKQGLTIRMAWDIKKERVLYSPGPRSICGCIRHGSRTHGTGVQDRQNNCKKETTGMDTFEKIRALLAEQLDVDPAKITMDSDIMSDFEADSLCLLYTSDAADE